MSGSLSPHWPLQTCPPVVKNKIIWWELNQKFIRWNCTSENGEEASVAWRSKNDIISSSWWPGGHHGHTLIGQVELPSRSDVHASGLLVETSDKTHSDKEQEPWSRTYLLHADISPTIFTPSCLRVKPPSFKGWIFPTEQHTPPLILVLL